jgi:hypothetical protein
MARKDRHTLLVGRQASGLGFARGCSQEHRSGENRVGGSCGPRAAKCDQYFSSTLWGGDRQPAGTPRYFGKFRRGTDSFVKGLILAQNERWRRGLGMQVERAWLQDQVSGARVSKATATNPMVGHSRGKLRVIPSDVHAGHPVRTKVLAPWDGPSWY